MKTVFHKAATRGHASHGWLDSWHTFSFGSYYDPARIRFGTLRVLNDDTVAPGMGFGLHPHENMEIISIPLEGDLEHSDSTGKRAIIRQGDVQVMSAGTGIMHSEKNAATDKPVKFLQIWVLPAQKGVSPRYDQKSFSEEEKHNNLLTVVAPMGHPDVVTIHQDAWFSLGNLDEGVTATYNLKKAGNGIYAFLLEGELSINEVVLQRRDGLGLTEVKELTINATRTSSLLLMEVPMN